MPHGYLSDDEGVDEVHPGELEEAAKEADLMPPPSSSKKNVQRKKFIPKEPILFGPFHSQDQVIPQCLQGSTVQFIGESGNNPFANLEAVFVGLESGMTKKSAVNEGGAVFPDALLPSLIQVTRIVCVSLLISL